MTSDDANDVGPRRDKAERGYRHHYTTEQLRAFRAVPAAEKLRWLEELRRFCERFLTPERRALRDRFRRGDL